VPRRVTAGAIELLRKQNSAHSLFALPAFAAAPPERLAQLLDSVLMVSVHSNTTTVCIVSIANSWW
jgi:hypothetical protein